jgi:uncharacterized membrane protein
MLGLVIFVACVGLIAVGVSVMMRCDAIGETNGVTAGFFLMIMPAIAIIIMSVIFIGARVDVATTACQIEATRETIAESRKGEVGELERAAVLSKMIEYNAWLADKRYWNSGTWDYWIPDSVMTIEPLK